MWPLIVCLAPILVQSPLSNDHKLVRPSQARTRASVAIIIFFSTKRLPPLVFSSVSLSSHTHTLLASLFLVNQIKCFKTIQKTAIDRSQAILKSIIHNRFVSQELSDYLAKKTQQESNSVLREKSKEETKIEKKIELCRNAKKGKNCVFDSLRWCTLVAAPKKSLVEMMNSPLSVSQSSISKSSKSLDGVKKSTNGLFKFLSGLAPDALNTSKYVQFPFFYVSPWKF